MELFSTNLFLSILIYWFILYTKVQSSEIASIEYTLNLIEEGDKKIQIGQHENVLLLLGNTGSGKSTLAQLLAGDNDQLFSKEVRDGTGEYIIVDSNDRISNNSTLISKTIFPELVFDSNTNTAYYDCTGFSDTRNSSIDIASTYFIHKIISAAQNIKSVFVVNYSSMQEGVDRADFLQLLKHAANLIKDFSKFQNGIALVVTKVDNIYVKAENGLNLVSDEKVISNIAQFIENAKISITELIEKENDEIKKTNYYNCIKLIDLLLTIENNQFNKIGIFRRPDEAGQVSKISILQSSKNQIQNVLQNNMQYVARLGQDFGYSISDESKNYINNLSQEIDSFIGKILLEIAVNVKNNYLNIESNLSDFKILNHQYLTASDLIKKMLEHFNTVTMPNQLVQILKDTIQSLLNLVINEENLLNILKYNNFLEFLSLVTTNTIYLKPDLLKSCFTDLINYLDDSQFMYLFLDNLKLKLSEWTIQMDISRFNIANFKTQIQQLQASNILITGLSIKEFLNELYYDDIQKGYALPGFDSIEKAEINQFKINAMFSILDFSLIPKVSYACEDNVILIAKGEYVKVQEALSNLNACLLPITTIKIYASQKIFVDAHIEIMGENVQVIFIAPILEIIDSRVINLLGKTAITLSKAQNGETPTSGIIQGANGGNGINGLPGLKGHSGGSFFSVINKLIKGENLIITSMGGNGAAGQIGGDGGNGENGKDVDWVVTKSERVVFWKIEKCEQKGGLAGTGGNGGTGGKGGGFGPASEVQILGLLENNLVQIKQVNGQPGADGAGGLPGIGGSSGNQCTGTRINQSNNMKWSNIVCNKIKADDGLAGITGQISDGSEIQDNVVIINKKLLVAEFKNFVQPKIEMPLLKNELTEFLNIINSLPNIN